MKEGYFIARTCSDCGHEEQIAISKKEAAFELVDIHQVLGFACGKCAGKSFSVYYERPDLDLELLREWANRPELFLMPQDEELLLAEGEYLDMILTILDTPDILERKRHVLMQALCVLVYDNSEDEEGDLDLRDRVISEINKRKGMLEAADVWIMGYIKKVVYPQLFGKGN